MPGNTGVSIAYFSMDSLQSSYDYVLSIKRTFEAKQATAQDELIVLEKEFQQRVQKYQSSMATLTKRQAESAQRELYNLQQEFESKKAKFQAQLLQDQNSFVIKVQQEVQDYISQHRDEYPYDFILADQPNVIFYKNAAYDITSQLIEDLNADFQK